VWLANAQWTTPLALDTNLRNLQCHVLAALPAGYELYIWPSRRSKSSRSPRRRRTDAAV
jgi:hypothetical protein